jgi:predicted dehydrogenase
MSRKRGRIILVGVIGLELNRAEFYEKELTFQVSCSYGPGRYDDNYEQKGQDYPIPFVRWTEKRNFRAVLQAISSGVIDVKSLITEIVPLEEYQKVYGKIGENKAIASILSYGSSDYRTNVALFENANTQKADGMAIIGAGNFTKMTMLPALSKTKANLASIVSNSGVSGTALAKKYKIAQSSTDFNNILADASINTVLITTRHNLHAPMTTKALWAGKNVFVEKPLALSKDELRDILDAYQKGGGTLNVGFNRRFSTFAKKMKALLGSDNSPMNVVATMNAGSIPANVWVHDLKIGGGRIVGEACHFIDLISYFTGSQVQEVCMNSMGMSPQLNTDNATILLKYQNGSTGVINYFANGSKAYSKERIEVYSQDRTLVLDNWRTLEGFGFKGFSSMKSRMDKGHNAQFELLVNQILSQGDALIPIQSLVNTTLASFAALESITSKSWVSVEL